MAGSAELGPRYRFLSGLLTSRVEGEVIPATCQQDTAVQVEGAPATGTLPVTPSTATLDSGR